MERKPTLYCPDSPTYVNPDLDLNSNPNDSEDEIVPGTPPPPPFLPPPPVPKQCEGCFCQAKGKKNPPKWMNAQTFDLECEFCAATYQSDQQGRGFGVLDPFSFGTLYHPISRPKGGPLQFEKYVNGTLMYSYHVKVNHQVEGRPLSVKCQFGTPIPYPIWKEQQGKIL